MRIYLLGIILLSILNNSYAQLTPVILDENFDEWTNIQDLANPSSEGNLPIKAINTDEYLFLYFEVAQEISIQNEERIVLYINTDNDDGDGILVNGMGANLEVNFGTRTVTFRDEPVSLTEVEYVVGFQEIGLVVLPTVRSNKYEIAIRRDADVDGYAVFNSPNLEIIVEDKTTQTFSPVATGGAGYTFGDFSFDDLPSYSIDKIETGQLRFMSHNVLFDNLFDEVAQPSFQRMYQAILPDIIGFQEIYNHDGATVAALMDEMMPLADEATWYGSNVHDNVVVSKYPIKGTYEANNNGNGAFLLDLTEDYGTDILMIDAHTPCCDNDAGRQSEIDAIMAFVRDAKASGGALTIPENTPIILMGDFNLVGDPQNTLTLINGDIQDENTWGSDFTPDWDGSNFIDALPIVTGEPMRYTHWSSTEVGKFSNGRLDAIVFSGFGMTMENSYVLYTETMSDAELTLYGLERGDSQSASDHLPLIADYTITAIVDSNISLIDLRSNNSDGVPSVSGQVVTVSGVVTADEEFGPNLSYMQNDEAGVAIFGGQFENLFVSGDSISITAKVTQYNGLTELVYDASSSVTVHKSGLDWEPPVVSISDVNDQAWNGYELIEGTLVKLLGVEFEETGTFSAGSNYSITDGTNSLTLRIDSNVDLVGEDIREDKFNVIGVIGQYDSSLPYSSGYQILPRSRTDIEDAYSGILALRKNDENGVPVYDDILVTTSGIVTVSNTFGSNGLGYVQDDDAGISIFGSDLISLMSSGDSISITAVVTHFNGQSQLKYDAVNSEVIVHKTVDIPDPKVVTIDQINNQNWNGIELLEGLLIMIQDVTFVETGTFLANTNYTISDGSSSATIRIDGDTDMVGTSIPSETLDLIGLVGQFDSSVPYSTGYQVYPRSVDDLMVGGTMPLISELKEKGIKVYPNPVTAELKVEWVDFHSMSLYSLAGVQVLTSSEKVISLKELQSGFYILVLKDNNGDQVKVKIVKD